MAHPLDRPVWHSLRGRQAHLAQVHGQALRIDPAYGPFAAAAPGHERDLAACLGSADDEIWVVEVGDLTPPPGTRLIRTAPLAQMVAVDAAGEAAADPEIVTLDESDVAEMTQLALATQPGPWGPSTAQYGTFYGIRQDGRLAAMAGERLRPAPGIAEVSGVCTWPEFRGQHMAGRLIRRVVTGLVARGDTPFLHSYAGNSAAIGLYERLGFRIRRELVVTVLGVA